MTGRASYNHPKHRAVFARPCGVFGEHIDAAMMPSLDRDLNITRHDEVEAFTREGQEMAFEARQPGGLQAPISRHRGIPTTNPLDFILLS